MLKNGIVKALAVVAVLGVAACNQNQEAPAVEETPASETFAPAPEVAPAPEFDPAVDPAVTDTVAPAEDADLETAPPAGN